MTENEEEKFLKLHTKCKQTLIAFTLICGLLVVLFLGQFIYSVFSAPSNEVSGEYGTYDNCNVIGIEIRGDIYTYVPTYLDGSKLEGYDDTVTSEDVMALLSDAELTDSVKGVLIEVDSSGGSPVASEEISNYIKNMNKPVVSFIRDTAVSAAYLSIVPSDRIFALKSSDVGGIGVTQSYLENVSKNQQEGYSLVQLSTGKFKDSGSPDKPITEEEKDLFMRDLTIIHENFMQTVSEHRGIEIERIREIADGSSVLGEQAKLLGLIDEIGGYTDAVSYLGDVMGEEAVVCW